jgi:CHAT domain-containing protein
MVPVLGTAYRALTSSLSRRASIVALVIVSVVSLVGFLVTGPLLLFSAEQTLARIYLQERPFLFRLPARGYGPVRTDAVRPPRLAVSLSRIQTAQFFFHNEAKLQLLLGRVALLNGDFDEAAGRYLRSLKLDRRNRGTSLEFAGVLMVRAQRQHRPVDLAAALQYAGSAHGFDPAAALDSYNLALLYESIPAPYLARDEWARCRRLERDARWRAEADAHWQAQNRIIEERATRIRALQAGPESFLAQSRRRPYQPEAALDEAICEWFPRKDSDPSAREALRSLAAQFQARHGDSWLADVIGARPSPSAERAARFLSEACRRNRDGAFRVAVAASAEAQELFHELHNQAGELMARLETLYGARRGKLIADCVRPAQSLFQDLQATSYVWLKADAWLEETSCHSSAGDSGRLPTEREDALQWIRKTGYTGLELRAVGFLIQPELIRANPMRFWRLAHDGLVDFWAAEVSATRAQQFYIGVALAGGDGLFPLASLVMAREGVRVFAETRNVQFQALCRAILGFLESSAGLRQAASLSFQEADRLFAMSPPTNEVRGAVLEAALFRADAELADGDARAAIARLTPLEPELSLLGETGETRPFRLILGEAFVRQGLFQEAEASFTQALSQARLALEKVSDQAHRDALLQAVDGAYRGLIFLKLVRDRNTAGAFSLWQTFRAERTGGKSATAAFPKNASLLAVVTLPGGSAVFAKDPDDVQAKWIPDGTPPLDDYARTFTELCSIPSSSQAEIERVGRLLYNALIGPFENRLLGMPVLAIDAEGPLAAIPWSALPDSTGERLIERQTIVLGGLVISSPPAEIVRGERRPLVVDSPALSPEYSVAYPPLGDSIREAKEIVRRFPNARVLRGAAATAEMLKDYLPHSTFFHFGGHGTANGGYGAILLAPGPSSSGFFDASQIGRLDLRGVRVVSLASCSSGAGQTAGAVNPDSLVRALLDAGVQNVVAAPWNVDSETTSELFGDFYGRLPSSGSASAALRQSCLRISRRPGAEHPYFWSGFQIYGKAE